MDAIVARFAEARHGVVTRSELLDLGCPPGWIRHRLQKGVLRPLYRGVYAFGHAALTEEGRWLAAVRAVGKGAVLSHRPAGVLHGYRVLLEGPVVVTSPTHARSRPARSVRHAGQGFTLPALRVVSRRLDLVSVTSVRGVPTTGPLRTLIDLCETLDDRELEAVLDGVRRLDVNALRAELDRAPKHVARTRLAHVLAQGPRTRSELERVFLRFAARHDLPRPECNQWVEGLLVDCVWRDHRVVLELDSQAWHAHMGARRNDFDRDAKLLAAGWIPLRAAWADLTRDPERALRRLRPFLT